MRLIGLLYVGLLLAMAGCAAPSEGLPATASPLEPSMSAPTLGQAPTLTPSAPPASPAQGRAPVVYPCEEPPFIVAPPDEGNSALEVRARSGAEEGTGEYTFLDTRLPIYIGRGDTDCITFGAHLDEGVDRLPDIGVTLYLPPEFVVVSGDVSYRGPLEPGGRILRNVTFTATTTGEHLITTEFILEDRVQQYGPPGFR